MSYHGMGLTRPAPRYTDAPVIQNLRTYADVWKNPNPSGRVETGRFHDIGIPLPLQRQLQAELDARQSANAQREIDTPLKGRTWDWITPYVRKAGMFGMGEVPYLDCGAIIAQGGTGTACVDENLRRQQANMAEHDSGQRAIFVANCKRDYALNHGGSDAGNQCDSFSFGSSSPYAQPAPPVTAVGIRPGQLTFRNLTSGNAARLAIGDDWQVSITGATPGLEVSVRGGQNGASTIASMGRVDSSGNFSLSGRITPDQVGTWQETWSVESAPSGSFSFTVPPATSSQQKASTPPPVPPINKSAGGDGSGSGYVPFDVNHLDNFAMQGVGGIPMWALIAAGGAALLFFGGKR